MNASSKKGCSINPDHLFGPFKKFACIDCKTLKWLLACEPRTNYAARSRQSPVIHNVHSAMHRQRASKARVPNTNVTLTRYSRYSQAPCGAYEIMLQKAQPQRPRCREISSADSVVFGDTIKCKSNPNGQFSPRAMAFRRYRSTKAFVKRAFVSMRWEPRATNRGSLWPCVISRTCSQVIVRCQSRCIPYIEHIVHSTSDVRAMAVQDLRIQIYSERLKQKQRHFKVKCSCSYFWLLSRASMQCLSYSAYIFQKALCNVNC